MVRKVIINDEEIILPTNISYRNNKFKLNIRNKYINFYKTFDTLFEAIIEKDIKLKEINELIKINKIKVNIIKELKIKINELQEFKIPLKNKNHDIIDYAIVSKQDYLLLNQFKWHKNIDGYAKGVINNKMWLLHRYIIIEILKNNIDMYNKVDHADNNKLNNQRNNLNIVSNSENVRNKKKKKNTISKYIGVSYNKKKWYTQITINKNLKLYASYDNEAHCANQYNLWIEEYNLTTAKLNIISEELIKDFILYKPPIKKGGQNIPKGISIDKNNKFRIRINNKQYGSTNTLEKAIVILNIVKQKIENIKQKKIKQTPIKRNKFGECIIEIFNIKKEKICETIVDEYLYYDLIQYKWSFSNNNYIQNSKLGFLHRHIMNYIGKDYIDHINTDRLDNRLINLRIATPQQNSMNKSSQKNSSSKYLGVSFNMRDNKWIAYIRVNSKNIHLGTFENQDDAAKARDEATIKHFGKFGKLNFKEN